MIYTNKLIGILEGGEAAAEVGDELGEKLGDDDRLAGVGADGRDCAERVYQRAAAPPTSQGSPTRASEAARLNSSSSIAFRV